MKQRREQEPCRWRLQSGCRMTFVTDEWAGKQWEWRKQAFRKPLKWRSCPLQWRICDLTSNVSQNESPQPRGDSFREWG